MVVVVEQREGFFLTNRVALLLVGVERRHFEERACSVAQTELQRHVLAQLPLAALLALSHAHDLLALEVDEEHFVSESGRLSELALAAREHCFYLPLQAFYILSDFRMVVQPVG